MRQAHVSLGGNHVTTAISHDHAKLIFYFIQIGLRPPTTTKKKGTLTAHTSQLHHKNLLIFIRCEIIPSTMGHQPA